MANESILRKVEAAAIPHAEHPSLGQPGCVIAFRPAPLRTVPDPTLRTGSDSTSGSLVTSAVHSQDGAGLSSSTILVEVPPASVPLVFAHRQWRAGMLLADAIAADAGPFSVQNEICLELGCGTALPGIIAARKGTARFVVVTDYAETQLIDALKENVRRNVPAKTLRSKDDGGARVLGYTWGSNTEDLTDLLPARMSSAFTRIILADCIWDSLSHQALLSTIERTLEKSSSARVLVVAGLHTGRDTLWAFLRRAGRRGLRLRSAEPKTGIWPQLPIGDDEASSVNALDESDPLHGSEDRVIELELAEEVVVDAPTSKHLFPGQNVVEAFSSRLTGRRRRFATAARLEENRMKGDSIHPESIRERNRWITVYTLGWESSMVAA